MSNAEHRIAANRSNALKSTGPVTADGKATVGQNATRHGLLSAKLLLDDDDPAEFQDMLGDLSNSLNPVGALEASLVERIAVTLWRQRRLVAAETASLSLARQPKQIAKTISSEVGRGYSSELKEEEIAPFDAESEQWCRSVVAEIDGLEEIEVASLEKRAPNVYAQLVSDAEDEDQWHSPRLMRAVSPAIWPSCCCGAESSCAKPRPGRRSWRLPSRSGPSD